MLIRNPFSTRPWQHVLEPINGYLILGYNFLRHQKIFSIEFWPKGQSAKNVKFGKDFNNYLQPFKLK